LCEKTNEKKKERPINFPYICIKVFFRFTLCLPKNYARLPISETKKIEKFKVFCVYISAPYASEIQFQFQNQLQYQFQFILYKDSLLGIIFEFSLEQQTTRKQQTKPNKKQLRTYHYKINYSVQPFMQISLYIYYPSYLLLSFRLPKTTNKPNYFAMNFLKQPTVFLFLFNVPFCLKTEITKTIAFCMNFSNRNPQQNINQSIETIVNLSIFETQNQYIYI